MIRKIVFLGDGMADKSPDGSPTPLQAASTPNMDRMAQQGRAGIAQLIPPGLPVGSDVANLAVLGYDPRAAYSGRGPLEAASIGVDISAQDVAFRCNLVCIQNEAMTDFAAGHISSAEAAELIAALQKELGTPEICFHSGISYRHLLIADKGAAATCTPPHDIIGQQLADFWPQGADQGWLRQLMLASRPILEAHPVNLKRVAAGTLPANQIWPWGQGHRPKLATFQERFGISGAVITGVDLIKGIGHYAGLKIIEVPGATGYLDTNFLGKGQAALDFLATGEFVYIHVEAPDEAGHLGDYAEKVRAIESFDRDVVGTVISGLESQGLPYRALLLPDHYTPVHLKTHTADPVPVVVSGAGIPADSHSCYDEGIARNPSFKINPGFKLINRFFSANFTD